MYLCADNFSKVMKYGIIAAGEGSRLAREGIATPKPLVKVRGECLIDRLLHIFMRQGAETVYVICRATPPAPHPLENGEVSPPVPLLLERGNQVFDHLQGLRRQGMPIETVMKSTPSSMHSLYELSLLMGDGAPLCLTTVDTVFRETEFADFLAELRRLLASGEADGLMGVTDYIDDEKPLYVRCDERRRVTAFLDSDEHPHYVSAGIYGLSPRAFGVLRACIERGESRMRNFQRALLADGLRLQAWPFTEVLDIDHAADIRKAERLLAG